MMDQLLPLGLTIKAQAPSQLPVKGPMWVCPRQSMVSKSAPVDAPDSITYNAYPEEDG